MRQYLLGGRVRTSTVLVALVFIITLVIYLLVRPVPASIAGGQPTRSASPTIRPAETAVPTTTGPAPTSVAPRPTVSRTGSPSPSGAPTSPLPTPTPAPTP
jgi:hypothetical protein